MTLRRLVPWLAAFPLFCLLAVYSCTPAAVQRVGQTTLLGCDVVAGLDAETVALVWHVQVDKVRALQSSCAAAELVANAVCPVMGAAGAAGAPVQ
jgi:hypothetical protein